MPLPPLPTVTVRAARWDDADAVALRAAMSAEMGQRYADRTVPADVLTVHDDTVVWTGIAVVDGAAVGHAALRRTGDGVELKRMYVAPDVRGRGVAAALLEATHEAARALGARRVLLQTGDRQPDAVRLYERAGYRHVPVFPPYDQIDFSVCLELVLPG